MYKDMSIIDIIKKARDKIASQDRVPIGCWLDTKGNYCAIGALYYAVGVREPEIPCENNIEHSIIDNDILPQFRSAAKKILASDSSYRSPYKLNDDFGRDKVLKMYDHVIAQPIEEEG